MHLSLPHLFLVVLLTGPSLVGQAERPPAPRPGPAGQARRPAQPRRPLAKLFGDFERERKLPYRGRSRTLSLILARRGPKVAAFILRVLPDEKEPKVQATLARALGRRAKAAVLAEAVPTLWTQLPVPALTALVGGLKPEQPEGFRTWLKEQFADKSTDLRLRRALLRLVALPVDAGTLPLLRDVIYRESDFMLIRAAATHLAQVPDSPDKKALVLHLVAQANLSLAAQGIRMLPLADEAWLLQQVERIFQRELLTYIKPRPAIAGALATRLADRGGVKALKLFIQIAGSRPQGQTAALEKLAPRFRTGPCLDHWLTRVVRHRDEHLRLLALAAIAGSDDPRTLEAVRRLTRDKVDRVRRTAIRLLGRFRSDPALSTLEKTLKRGRNLEERIEALDALHRIRQGTPEWTAVLVKLLGSRHEALRARAVDLLAQVADPAVFAKVVKAGRDRSWLIRSAVYGYAYAVRDPRFVPLLIRALRAETGRLRGEVEKALHRIAGLTFHFDVKRWEAWWKAEGPGFTPPPVKGLRRGRGAGRNYANSYYGIPVLSQRIIFILDISGSMAAKVGTGGQTRLDRAKEALTQALLRFQKDTHFNIIFFHSVLNDWERKLTPATKDNRRRALEYVRKQTPMGATNIYGALELAYQDKTVDTVFLLTDGSPTAGTVTDPDKILEQVKVWNRTRRLIINCISLGGNSALLRKLAEMTKGQFVRR